MHPKLKVISGLASSSWRAALVCALLAVGSSLSAKSLQTSSPFLPPENKSAQSLQKKEAPKQLQSNRFMLRGVSKIGNTYLFSIFDKKSKKSRWVEAGTNVNGLEILSFDPTTRTVKFALSGKEGQMELQTASDEPIALNFAARSDQVGSVKVERVNNPQSNVIRRSPQRVVFSQDIAHSPRQTSTSLGLALGGYISKDTFANSSAPKSDLAAHIPDDEPKTTSEAQANSVEVVKPYKVKRRNKVHNPVGQSKDWRSNAAHNKYIEADTAYFEQLREQGKL